MITQIKRKGIRGPSARMIVIFALAFAPKQTMATDLSGNETGPVTLSVTDAHVRLLRGFYFHFTKADHPLKTISLYPNHPSTLALAFGDRDPSSPDDAYDYRIKTLPLNDLRIRKGTCLTNLALSNWACPVRVNEDEVIVLTGFQFTYLDNDFAVKKIEVVVGKDAVGMSLYDRGLPKKLSAALDYAILPKDLIVSDGNEWTSSIDGQGPIPAPGRPIRSGLAVIAGFVLEFVGDDARIKELGVIAEDGVAKILFNDQSLARAYTYKVNYCILKNVAAVQDIITTRPPIR